MRSHVPTLTLDRCWHDPHDGPCRGLSDPMACASREGDMAAEVARFQLARSPQRACLDLPPRPLRLEDLLNNSEFLGALLAAEPDARRDLAREWYGTSQDEPLTSIADLDVPRAGQLAALDDWLSCEANRPVPNDVRAAVERLLDREVVEGSTDGRFDPNDDLYENARTLAELLVVGSILGADASRQRLLIRALLILGLLETLLYNAPSLTQREDVLALLRDRIILLPKKIFPLPHRAKLARRPGFADLHVVRQEWNRYEAGEIAHIENVLASELKKRVHTRTDEMETTETIERARSTFDEHDVESTSRFELSENTSADTAMLVHVEAQVDTSGVYGPTQVDTHLGGSLDFSQEDSEEHASTQAYEIIARAVSRVEETVREVRTVRTLNRIVEENTHELKAEDEPVVGMYRWVDKIVRLQRFRYPHRYLLEFQVPEPAAYVRWLELRNADRGFRSPKPVPFTLDGNAESADNLRLIPTDISEDPASAGSYLRLAARWHAIGITAPPPEQVTASGWLHVPSSAPDADKTSHDVWVTPLEGSTSGTGAAGGVEGEPVKVPDGYEADNSWTGWFTAWDQDDAIRPGFLTNANWESWSAFPPEAYVTVGDSQNDPTDTDTARNLVVDGRSAKSMPIGGDLQGRRTGTLPITALTQNYGFFSVQVRVTCQRQASAVLVWQMDTYNKLRAAYFEMLREHEEEQAAREVQAGVVIQGRSPLENARIVREELKRQTIELLLGERFDGVDAVDRDVGTGRPLVDIDATVKSAPLIQFLEQVFEWENLTYVLYPYFWADDGQWDELQGIQSPDPDFARFLRSGSARVVVAARPGYQRAIDYFLLTGIPWGPGGIAPGPDEVGYISVAAEIMAQTGAPDEGKPSGKSWEVRLPTTLLCLDPMPQLPKDNDQATLPDPPQVPG
jgi:hypothetical protein